LIELNAAFNGSAGLSSVLIFADDLHSR
jgi:hypothetical protein